MKKIKPLIITALFFLTAPIAHAATYSDLPEVNRNAPAIEYLSEVGIINGYPDGTFKPDNPVNRVEFLKLVLASSEIETDVNEPANFPDIENDQWYSKYVRKAYKEGWIEGYPDGTFKPEQPINKVEALKIIGEVQNWNLPASLDTPPFLDIELNEWYSPYISYAKDKNFLEETTHNFIPETLYSRAKISELLFRSFITQKSGREIYDFTLINQYPASEFKLFVEADQPEQQDEIIQQEFTPVQFNSFDRDFFENIQLDEKFPNTFYLNEVYYFRGEIKDGNFDRAFVFLSNNGQPVENYSAEVKENKFSIPVIFKKSGNFRLGLIPGDAGESKVIDISVLPQLPEPETSIQGTRAPTELTAQYENQKTTFKWDSRDYELIKISFYQGDLQKDYIFRQGFDEFSIPYEDFKNFGQGKTYFSAVGADLQNDVPLEINNKWSNPTGINFTTVVHQYSYVDENLISIESLPESLNTRSIIQFNGTAQTDILTQGAIIKPDGFVDIIEISSPSPTANYYGSSYIPAGNEFTFSYLPETTGTYAIEINGTDGSAVLNSPVYIGSGIPLIPNFFDLYENNNQLSQIDPDEERNNQLNLINAERVKFGLNPVTLDNDLNMLAQDHTDDMIERNFFSHVNPEGKTPNDRRIEAGIPTPVGENLAIAPTSEYTIYGLMQSGIHRKNILDPKWTKVGIGISLNQQGSLYTTQEFSSDALTESNLQDITRAILDAVNEERENNDLNIFTVDGTLETPADIWTVKMTTQDFFDFTSPDGESLANVVRQYVPTKAIQALIVEGSNQEKIIEEILKSPEIADSGWQKIGVGISVDEFGLLKSTVLFTTL